MVHKHFLLNVCNRIGAALGVNDLNAPVGIFNIKICHIDNRTDCFALVDIFWLEHILLLQLIMNNFSTPRKRQNHVAVIFHLQSAGEYDAIISSLRFIWTHIVF